MANATSFKPRVSEHPVRDAIDAVVTTEPEILKDAIRRCLADERHAHAVVDLIGPVVIGQGRSHHIVRDIVIGALQDVARTDPKGLQRALLGALRGRDGFRTLVNLARLIGGVVNITFGPPTRRSLGAMSAARAKERR
jgi:hypothetical protein